MHSLVNPCLPIVLLLLHMLYALSIIYCVYSCDVIFYV